MITRPATRLLGIRIVAKRPIDVATRAFSATSAKQAKNRIYTSVRLPDDFQTYLLLSTSSRSPFLTFWTASNCNTCKIVSPILKELITSGVGEAEGGVTYAEIEYDCPDIMESGLGMTYMITSMPTLLSFDRGEAQVETKVVDPKLMKDRVWLKEWIRTEARRRGSGGSGSSGLGKVGIGLFGGLFGNTR